MPAKKLKKGSIKSFHKDLANEIKKLKSGPKGKEIPGKGIHYSIDASSCMAKIATGTCRPVVEVHLKRPKSGK